MSTGYLIDTSAWMRLEEEALPAERVEELAAAIAASEVWASIILRLEVGYTARNAAQHAVDQQRLDGLPQATVDAASLERAVELQSQLAKVGHHRVPPADLVTVAIAERHGLAVLHYDKDYDVIADRTDCAVASEWLAPRGSV
ncbi:MAG: PIN domain-containing protein [Gaiellales bacterium]